MMTIVGIKITAWMWIGLLPEYWDKSGVDMLSIFDDQEGTLRPIMPITQYHFSSLLVPSGASAHKNNNCSE